MSNYKNNRTKFFFTENIKYKGKTFAFMLLITDIPVESSAPTTPINLLTHYKKSNLETQL